MKKYHVFLSTLMLVFSSIAFATDENNNDTDEVTSTPDAVMTEAPPSILQEATDTCRAWAQEEEQPVPANELENYLLSCINGMLNDQGYLSISKLNPSS